MKYTVLIVCSLLLSAPALGQKRSAHPKQGRIASTTDSVAVKIAQLQKTGRWKYPITDMWDDALAHAQKSHKPVIVFNVDFADSASVGFRNRILRDPEVLVYLFEHFECAINDFSVDPPPSVGFDSLRNLGHRLDGLEKGYGIGVRPTAILLRPDSSEIERIAYPNLLTGDQFIARVTEYMHGVGTVERLRQRFWSDTTNFAARKLYLDRLSERSEYDSVVYQLGVIAQMRDHLTEAREAAKQYAYLRMNVEGQTQFVRTWIASLGKSDQDSQDALQGLRDLLEFYQMRKKIDSIAVCYDRIFAFTGVRDPETLNNYAWDLATHSKRWEEALKLVDEAIAAKPTSADFYDTRALAHWSLKQYDAAVHDAQDALAHAKGKDDKSYFKERLQFYKAQLKQSKEPKPAEPSSGSGDGN
ncbi:MAG: hypothetical protein JSS75_06220 [Bacteroidetes bacterium]|nr:hypothetical protein [Bacteroidota bacterium]